MIPKIAHFHWAADGPTMPWLRHRAMDTFRKFHPDWDVRLHDTLPEIKRFNLGWAQQADWTWWEMLNREGGWQIATDIIFVRRIPDDWLDCDINACQNGVKGVYQFAAMGASPDNPYMKACVDRCLEVARRGDGASYQRYGVELLKELGGVMFELGGKLVDQPMDAFCSYDCSQFPRLWETDPLPETDESVIGIHWYGGGQRSVECEASATEDSDYAIVKLANKVLA